MNWKRTALIGTVSVGIAAAVFLGMRPQPLEVETVPVRLAPLEVAVEEEGKTRLRDRFVISAPLAGYLRRHNWKVGDSIQAGQTVAVIEPLRAEVLDSRRLSENQARLQAAAAAREGADARLAAAQQQLRAAEADADYWKQQLAREEKLMASGDIPAERVDRTRAEGKRTEAVRLAAEQAVAQARSEIARTRAEVDAARAAASNPAVRQQGVGSAAAITSPVSGRVVKLIRQSEGVSAPGEPILELGNTRGLEVEVELLSSDAVKVGPGTRVRLTRWGGEIPLEAQVRLVEPTGFTKISALGVEEQRVRVIADILSPEDQWKRLGEGYRVEAAFVLWSGDKVLQVPASALFREGDQWAVFVIADRFARRRAVTVGHRNGLAAEIVSGLKEGERVIPHPDDKVKDGVEVKLLGQ